MFWQVLAAEWLHFWLLKEYMGIDVHLEGTKAANISGKGKKRVWTKRINQMMQFELRSF